jgi:glycosyltransferase involved in cell wall biosynthesis
LLKLLAEKNKKIEFVINPSDEKMKKLYADCFLALCTFFNEDWGIVAIEANSFGKPVIAVNKGGYSESQIDGVTGYLLRADPVLFAEKMRLLASNGRFIGRMGDSARKNSKQYDWSYFIKSFDSTISRF